MGAGSFFRKRSDRVALPDQSLLRNQITAAIRIYLGVCGLKALLHCETILVARKNFDIFLMHGSNGLEDPTNVIGLFSLQEAQCFEEFKKVYSDPLLRSGALGKMTLGHLAAQLAERIIQQVTERRAQNPMLDTPARIPDDRDSLVLTMPATVEPK